MGIILALAALILPAAVIFRGKRGSARNPFLHSVGSFACCAAALCNMLFSIQRRVAHGDFGGIEDTIGALIAMAVALALVTVLLNLWALALSSVKDK